ncbi:CLAVATA3/ESR (CLE)-related protein 14 [Cardamine amara subsp. amara]|uniref:CLAVATA3/ESR (CLE)-related protein 14 n=1 Tax=Cardamine amara subsp. amara TaxID=228776 RepID=A0ABD1B8Y1_CARAN
MRFWSQRLSFLIFMIFLFSGIHFSSGGRKLPSTTAMEEFRRLSFDGERMLLDVNAGEKYDRIYGVSAREVPEGPNPLHNK